MKKPSTSYRLTADARELVEWLRQQLGISRTAVLEVAIRALARKEGKR